MTIYTICGGSWDYMPRGVYAAYSRRFGNAPGFHSDLLGLRLVKNR